LGNCGDNSYIAKMNPSSHDDPVSDDSGKDPVFHGHWSEEPEQLALVMP